MKAGKLKARVNMDNDLMYRVYWNRGQRSITLAVMSHGRFSKKLKCILLNNFNVCGPTSMECTTLGGFENVAHVWTVG